MLRKFDRRARLDADDHSAFLALPVRLQTLEANAYIIREGAPAKNGICVLLKRREKGVSGLFRPLTL